MHEYLKKLLSIVESEELLNNDQCLFIYELYIHINKIAEEKLKISNYISKALKKNKDIKKKAAFTNIKVGSEERKKLNNFYFKITKKLEEEKIITKKEKSKINFFKNYLFLWALIFYNLQRRIILT